MSEKRERGKEELGKSLGMVLLGHEDKDTFVLAVQNCTARAKNLIYQT